MKSRRVPRNIISYVILSIWSILILGIIGWVLSSSFKTNVAIFQDPWALPEGFYTANYVSAWTTMHMSTYFINSIVIVFSALLICLLVSAMMAYALSRFEYKLRKPLLALMIFSIAVPTQMLLIPLFSQLRNLGLINTRPGLILVYAALWIPFSLFVLTGFFRTIPTEIEESAILDGCGEARLFFQIFVPLVQPGLICVTVFNFVAMWNEYMLALVFASRANLRTISLGMYALRDSMMYSANWGGLFAAIIIMLIPAAIIFVTLQRYLIQGLTAGALKG